eukprot:1157485-Pelagomonas_calceolata.AAC.3
MGGEGCLHIPDSFSRLQGDDESRTDNNRQQAEERAKQFGFDLGGQQQGVLGVLHLLHIKDITVLNLNMHEPWPCEVQVQTGDALNDRATTMQQRQANEQHEQQQGHLHREVTAIAFVTPPDRLVPPGLHPPDCCQLQVASNGVLIALIGGALRPEH